LLDRWVCFAKMAFKPKHADATYPPIIQTLHPTIGLELVIL
jgi:hypothetical protein